MTGTGGCLGCWCPTQEGKWLFAEDLRTRAVPPRSSPSPAARDARFALVTGNPRPLSRFLPHPPPRWHSQVRRMC